VHIDVLSLHICGKISRKILAGMAQVVVGS
jgi:hypothetical protein